MVTGGGGGVRVEWGKDFHWRSQKYSKVIDTRAILNSPNKHLLALKGGYKHI